MRNRLRHFEHNSTAELPVVCGLVEITLIVQVLPTALGAWSLDASKCVHPSPPPTTRQRCRPALPWESVL